jgi:hypothetical protein
MNACDAPIGDRPSFTAGLEVMVNMAPAEVIDELAKTCLGQVSEMGGVFRMRVGAPAAPVQFITDEDIVISQPQELDPFPGLAASANAISSEYPEPASLWTSREAPQILNAAWEAEDGGRRLPTSINFPACSVVSQVAQLMSAYIKDARRFRTHRLVLPPRAFLLEPLDTIAWTSARNGYTNKIFEVVDIVDQPGTINQDLVLRERDPSDYGWSTAQDLPAVVSVTGLSPRPPQVIEGWSVSASTLKDALGLDRRPAISLAWIGTAAVDALFVRYEIRIKATAQIVSSGLADRAAGYVLISDGLLPETQYEVRGRYVLDRPTAWSSWLSVTTPGIYLNGADLRGGIKGLLADADLASVEILSVLPSTDNFPGRTVYLTTDTKLYRWTGSVWRSGLAASEIEGQLNNAQIEAIAAAKITGTLIEAQIANGAISGAKIATGAIEAGKVAAGAITAVKLAAGSVTTGKLAAGAVTADAIQAGAISTQKIAAGAVTAGLIAAGAIDAGKISVTQLSAITSDIGTATAGVIRSADGKFRIDLNAKTITITV